MAKAQKIDLVFPFDAKLEDDTIAAYNRFLLVCRENGDSISATINDEESGNLICVSL